MFEFQLPDVGEGIHEGEIVNWLVDEGDEVDEDEDIVEVMTDKATVQISAPLAGTISELAFAEGDTVEVGQVFVVIEPLDGQDVSPDTAAGAEPESPSPTETETQAGPQQAAEGDKPTEPTVVEASNGPQPTRTPEGILAPPSVRIEARKRGIDIADVEGTGPAGRIRMEDLTERKPAGTQEPAGKAGPVVAGAAEVLGFDIEPGSVDREHAREIEVIRAGAGSPRAHAARAKRLQPHFTHAVQIDADELVENVEQAGGNGREDEGATLDLATAFVVKAVAGALATGEHERCNAWVDEESRDLVIAEEINVAVATPTSGGLELRTVANANELGVRAIATCLAEGGDEDVEATFTVTAYNGLGGLVATPVLVHPQVAGASIGRIRDVPVLEDGEARAGKQLSLAFTFDHRYVDGYNGALLAEDVGDRLARPESMLLG